ncbi:Hypothetical predicted protein [Mytilus galloprovincialis]|uniref:Uncharacterized protein n=1 Tax=Mytilus galloprovincialis TaxID=29158 RepID=A0A8B6BZY0_MYTGA|nr:Hypothetical predicted protein [Mytilus galloprovincialis]
MTNTILSYDQKPLHDDLQSLINITFPSRYKDKALRLLLYLQKQPSIKWDEQGEVCIDGKVISNTHIVDLIRDSTVPIGRRKLTAGMSKKTNKVRFESTSYKEKKTEEENKEKEETDEYSEDSDNEYIQRNKKTKKTETNLETQKKMYVQRDINKSWRVPIRTTLHQAIGLVSGTLFLLIVSLTINIVTKQKLFCIMTKIAALGTGITAGYFTLRAIGDYKIGIPEALSEKARSLTDPVNRYYFPEKEDMQVGYNLAKYSAITTIIGCAFILGNIGLYIPFGEGKWIWQKKAEVIPETEKCPKQFIEKNKQEQPVKKKGGIVTVKEFVPE